jgi:hypothetical protein
MRLETLSLDTVKMFAQDAEKTGFKFVTMLVVREGIALPNTGHCVDVKPFSVVADGRVSRS